MPLDKITILSNEDPLGACPMKEFSAVLKPCPPDGFHKSSSGRSEFLSTDEISRAGWLNRPHLSSDAVNTTVGRRLRFINTLQGPLPWHESHAPLLQPDSFQPGAAVASNITGEPSG